MVEVGPMPYPVMNTLLDAGYPAGSLNYWLSSFTRGLPDELIDIAGRAVRVRPVADVGDPVRALPRRRDARRRRPTPPCRTATKAGTSSSRPSGRTRPTPTRTSPGRARRSPRCARTSATGRWLNYLGDDQAATPSAPPTARTTTGSASSSAATTRTTSSTTTTTSSLAQPQAENWRPGRGRTHLPTDL